MAKRRVLDNAGSAVGEEVLRKIESAVLGKIVRPGDEDYEVARKVWNGMINIMADWERVEADTIKFANKEIPHARNILTKTMLQVLEFEAQQHRLIQQMIIDSLKKEAVNLSPDELGILPGYINRYLEAEGKILCEAEGSAAQSEPFVTSYLFSYLMEDLKTQSCMLKQFEDELKNASIPTSVSSKKFVAFKAS